MQYEDVARYVTKLVGEGDELQAWTHEKSLRLSSHGVFPVDPTRGRFLELLARIAAPERVLEVGSGAGYSALWFMKGVGMKGRLDAIEVDADVVKELRSVLSKAGLRERTTIHHGAALDILRKLDGKYGLIFIDAEKDEYPAYLDEAFRLTAARSIIVADNMLWSGAVLEGGKRRRGVRGIIEYTKRIFADSRLCSIIVPLGDGLAVSYRMK